MNKNIKAIFFDLDGTLIDTKRYHFIALNNAIKEIAGSKYIIKRKEHKEIYDGLPTKKKLQILSNEKKLNSVFHNDICIKKQEETIFLIQKNCTQNDSLIQTIQFFKKKYKIAVCTNSIKNTMELILNKLNINDIFDLKLCNEDVENPKPEPDIYKTAINFFNLKPQECLVIEDNANGFKAALDAGCELMKVSGPKDLTIKGIKKYL